MKRRRVAGLVVVCATTFVLAVAFREAWVGAQDFLPPQNAIPQNTAPQNTFPQNTGPQNGAGAPELFPSQNPAPAPLDNPQPPADPSAPGTGDNADPNTEVLTRGAIHEAFAQPVVFNPTPSTVVPKQPPEPVEEIPPEQKPEGDHVVWIAGYWSWEAEHQKFIWTSGIWRSMPAGVEWVPGYWTQADGSAGAGAVAPTAGGDAAAFDGNGTPAAAAGGGGGGGWQWVNGFWRKNEATEVTYLPEKPPDTLEQGPVGVAPAANFVWIPGHWVWRGHYVWRPGFWAATNPDWIWIPAYYAWTPSGYVYCEGHWDFVMERRGVIFAPVVFRPGVVIGPGFVYSPAVAMDFGVCTGCLFCRPGFGCYCFGDYYGPAYASIGIYPWFSFHGRYGYDPCFAYYSWHYGPAWRERIVVDYRFRYAHIEARPPRTYAAMIRIGGRGPALAMHINVYAARGGGGGMRFERISAIRRQEIHRAVREQHLANARRGQMEVRGGRGGGGGPTKMSLPHSSLAATHNQGGRGGGGGGQGGHASNNFQHQQQQQQQQMSRQMQQQRNTRQPPRPRQPTRQNKRPGER